MKTLRKTLLAVCLAAGVSGFASADVRIHLSLFPDLVPVPGYPVYYAPGVEANFFFYDGMYWLYDDDGWYMSNWYDGPWEYVDPDDVPLFVLRVPLRYYRAPPAYFWGGFRDAPPRWGHYWGPGWERNHRDWDRWDHRRMPPPAPLPTYQRGYPRERYPDRQEQREIHERNYPNHSNFSHGDNNSRDRGNDHDNGRDERRDEGRQWQPERRPQEINQPPRSPREFNGGNNSGWQRNDEHRSNWGEGQQPHREQPQQLPQQQPHEREVIQPRYSMPQNRLEREDRQERPQPAQPEQRPQPERAREQPRGGWQQQPLMQRQPEQAQPQRAEPQQSVPGRGNSDMQGRGAEQQGHGRGFDRDR